MDFMQLGKHGPYYLMLINVNTRFLIAYPSKTKTKEETYEILKDAFNRYRIDSIKTDGEAAFMSKLLEKFYENNNTRHFVDASPFTYHNKQIDAAIRTIRNLFGPNSDAQLFDNNLMQQMIYYYNNTPHRAIKMTPTEMMADISEEWTYIRKMERKSLEYKLNNKPYSVGTIVMIHLDLGKLNKKSEENGETLNKFKKRRRNFDDIGEVIGFDHGNYKIKMLTSLTNEIIHIPQFAAQFLANNYEEFAKNKAIKQTFNL